MPRFAHLRKQCKTLSANFGTPLFFFFCSPPRCGARPKTRFLPKWAFCPGPQNLRKKNLNAPKNPRSANPAKKRDFHSPPPPFCKKGNEGSGPLPSPLFSITFPPNPSPRNLGLPEPKQLLEFLGPQTLLPPPGQTSLVGLQGPLGENAQVPLAPPPPAPSPARARGPPPKIPRPPLCGGLAGQRGPRPPPPRQKTNCLPPPAPPFFLFFRPVFSNKNPVCFFKNGAGPKPSPKQPCFFFFVFAPVKKNSWFENGNPGPSPGQNREKKWVPPVWKIGSCFPYFFRHNITKSWWFFFHPQKVPRRKKLCFQNQKSRLGWGGGGGCVVVVWGGGGGGGGGGLAPEHSFCLCFPFPRTKVSFFNVARPSET